MRTAFYGIGIATLLAAQAVAQDGVTGTLVLYTSQPNEDAKQTADAFMAAYPGVEVDRVRDGTTQIMARLEAEFVVGNPQPDVLLIADMDPEGHCFSTKLIPTGIVYNTAAPFVPVSWSDLLRPEAEGQIAMPLPPTSGAATIHMVSLTLHPDLGREYHEGLAGQGANPQGGNGVVYRAAAGGEQMFGMLVDFLPIREIPNGAPGDVTGM